jgi:hypothetical protein
MNTPELPVQRQPKAPEVMDPREELVQRVAASTTFEKSHRLRAFFLYVCQCALENRPEAATEQQIGIHVFGRPPGYSPNEDNIVRSQARLLRLKLEHHFAHEGKEEQVVITIPKGRYLPVFTPRFEDSASPPAPAPILVEVPRRDRRKMIAAAALVVVCAAATVWSANKVFRSEVSGTPVLMSVSLAPGTTGPDARVPGSTGVPGAGAGEIRIDTGNTGEAYVDLAGRRWEPDRYFEGGVVRPGPNNLPAPVAQPGVFKTIREAASEGYIVPQSQREFRYHIPAPPGVYELRLYFADPIRNADAATGEDAQNTRHFQINVNGKLLLLGYDPVAGAGAAPVDIRVFRDISPAADGKVHLEFVAGPERPFLSALELTPGIPGKLKPIRLSAQRSDFVDAEGVRWSGDNYFINGRIGTHSAPPGLKLPDLYRNERFGNFGYAIPVTPGSYTVKLHFAESFFSPLLPAGVCEGVGCRVFDVTCNGVALLRDFDVFQAASGAFRPVVRTFTGLRPNGQGKLVLSFSPKINYAEVRAIEVLDEAK